MNKFEQNFFKKYTPEWHDIKEVIHNHPINILWHLFLWLSLWVIIPSFLYYYSWSIKTLVPFFLIESWLYLIYIKIVYDIFDRYNDVWIITDMWVIELDRRLFKTRIQTIEYVNIEGIEVDRNWISDKILNKWDLIIHQVGNETFALYDAISPYKWLNTIEKWKHHIEEEDDLSSEKFDIIMDALWWVVENYLEKNGNKEDIIANDNNEYIKKYEGKEKTIDLR